jgi:DNA-binding NarL/FixJ family response regulator
MKSPEIRVALADDHPVVIAGIKALLENAPEVHLVGEATAGDEALRLFCSSIPDVAIMDISMPGLSGVELARRLAAECPQVKLLALTVHEDRAYIQHVLEAGARGYLLKRSAAEDLVRAVRAVAGGGIYLDPAIAGSALAAPRQGRTGLPAKGDLSEREFDVLRLAAQGFSNKEIAGRLEVGLKTVETYRARASEKLGLRTRADIVRFGVEQGWLERLQG